MNPEILTITLPEEKPPAVDARQIFEAAGTIFQVRLTLINNVLTASAVQQEQDPPDPRPPGSLLSTEEAAAFLGISSPVVSAEGGDLHSSPGERVPLPSR